MSAVACLPDRPHWATPRVYAAVGEPEPEGGAAALRAAANVWRGTEGLPDVVVVGDPKGAEIVVVAGPTWATDEQLEHGAPEAWLGLTAATAGPDGVLLRAEITISDNPELWVGAWDLVAVHAHELGHALGLPDLAGPGAIMSAVLDAGDPQLEVTAADRAAVEGLDADRCYGCSTAPGAVAPSLAWTLAALVVLGLLRRRQ